MYAQWKYVVLISILLKTVLHRHVTLYNNLYKFVIKYQR